MESGKTENISPPMRSPRLPLLGDFGYWGRPGLAYNFVTIHSTLKTTPAVRHGLTDHPWSIEEMLQVLAVHE